MLASTDKVYGELHTDAYAEDHPLAARGVYDVGKQSADTITRLYGTELGLPSGDPAAVQRLRSR